jgi:Predicted ATPase involved in replication control, Cdc46/Mcm family
MKGLSRGGIDFYCSTLSAYLSSAISPYLSNPSATALSKDIVIERLNAYIKHPYIFWIEDRGSYQYIFEINEFTGKYRTIVLDGVVPHFTPNLVARLFDVAVSRKGSIFVVLPDTYKKGDRALDGSEIIMVVPWLVYGVRARFEVYSTSSGLSESFDVFVPVGLWKIIISNIAKRYKVLATEIPPTVLINPKTRRKVAKTNFLAVGIIDDTEEEVLKNIEEEVKKIASLKTWEILRAAEVGVLGEFVKQEHVKIATLLTAFSQGLDKLKIELPNVTLSKDYGVLYTLLIGAPSAGKSKILSTIIQYANVDLSNYAKLDAHKMTAAGITASYDRDTRGVKIGVEPINHGRIVGYDEIDKAKDIDEVISTLNSIMSDYVVTYDKANIHARFPAVSAKIFVANLYGDYSVIQNIKDLYRVIENPEELGLRKRQVYLEIILIYSYQELIY